jgi:hypothetical protein
MAKRKTASRAITVRAMPMRAPTPIIRVAAPRAAAAPRHHKKHHRRHSSGGGNLKNRAIACAIAGYAIGFVDKSGTAIPTVPFLGRAGTIAAAAVLFGKGKGLWGDIALAAASIAGYEMGSTGKISGQVVPQVSGIAAQV